MISFPLLNLNPLLCSESVLPIISVCAMTGVARFSLLKSMQPFELGHLVSTSLSFKLPQSTAGLQQTSSTTFLLSQSSVTPRREASLPAENHLLAAMVACRQSKQVVALWLLGALAATQAASTGFIRISNQRFVDANCDEFLPNGFMT